MEGKIVNEVERYRNQIKEVHIFFKSDTKNNLPWTVTVAYSTLDEEGRLKSSHITAQDITMESALLMLRSGVEEIGLKFPDLPGIDLPKPGLAAKSV